MSEMFLKGRVTLHCGDNREVLRSLADCSIDSIVTDPPYALVSIVKRFGKANAAPAKGNEAYQRASAGFMGRTWDTGEVAFDPSFWAECLRVLKPGGHLIAFSGTRTYHRMTVAIEDSGFEIRDQLGYLYGSGFPKSHNISRALQICTCETVSERRLRSVRDANVSAPECVGERGREVLLEGLPQQGASLAGRSQPTDSDRTEKSCMEGRGDISEAPRQLRERSLREMSASVQINGEGGWLRNGASAGDGRMDRPSSGASGVCPSQGPFASEQSASEFGAMAGQSEPQARGAWENCRRCGKPLAPEGLGTALKPAWEPIVLARKAVEGTIAANVAEWGTGAINVDGCRVEFAGTSDAAAAAAAAAAVGFAESRSRGTARQSNSIGKESRDGTNRYDPFALAGRWPANIIHDGSEEVIAAFPDAPGQQRYVGPEHGEKIPVNTYGKFGLRDATEPRGDSGSAARFFYAAKADSNDRAGSKHPTVKPVDLMQWLVRLVTPKGGTVLDPFAGTGTTAEATFREGMSCVLIERESEYQADIRRRMALVMAGPEERARESIKARMGNKAMDAGPLFAEPAE